MARMTIIVNPHAGQRRAAERLPELRRFAERLPDVEIVTTGASADGRRLAQRALAAGSEIVVAAGGDGTVNEVLNGIMHALPADGALPTLGVLPLGSANDFARGLGLPDALDAGLDRLLAARVQRVDIGCVSHDMGDKHYFAFSVGVGLLGAAAAERFHIRYLRGRLLYVWALRRALARTAYPQTVHVHFGDGEQEVLALVSLSINNTPTVATFPLSPLARVDDGLFDVVTIGRVPLLRRLPILLLVALGRRLPTATFPAQQTDRVKLRAHCPLPIHVDGELYTHGQQTALNLTVQLLPAALPVVV
jgi:diacylglycerol kinase (ATP)